MRNREGIPIDQYKLHHFRYRVLFVPRSKIDLRKLPGPVAVWPRATSVPASARRRVAGLSAGSMTGMSGRDGGMLFKVEKIQLGVVRLGT